MALLGYPFQDICCQLQAVPEGCVWWRIFGEMLRQFGDEPELACDLTELALAWHRFDSLICPARPDASGTSFQFLKTSDEISRIDTQRGCESDDVFKRRIAATRFEAANVSSVDPSFESQRFLGHPEL